MTTARALDRAVERRWPWPFAYPKIYGPLWLAIGLLAVSIVLVLLGEPYAFGAGAVIGGALGLSIRVLIAARREENAKQR